MCIRHQLAVVRSKWESSGKWKKRPSTLQLTANIEVTNLIKEQINTVDIYIYIYAYICIDVALVFCLFVYFCFPFLLISTVLLISELFAGCSSSSWGSGQWDISGLMQDAAQVSGFFLCLSPFNDGLTIEALLIDIRDALTFYTLLFQADGVAFTLITASSKSGSSIKK